MKNLVWLIVTLAAIATLLAAVVVPGDGQICVVGITPTGGHQQVPCAWGNTNNLG